MLHNRFWQGFFALAPLASIFLVLFAYLYFLFVILQGGDPDHYFEGPGLPIGFILFIAVIFLVVLIAFASMIFYIVHAVQNPRLEENSMYVVWILLFIFANGIGQVVYWAIEILSKPDGGKPRPA